MFYFQVIIVLLLYGFTHVRSFFQFTHHLLPIENSDNVDNVGSETLWFEAPLDNFNESDHRTIKIRYCKNMDSWKPGGPIVILLNGMNILYEPYCTNPPLGGDKHSLIQEIVEETDAAFFIFDHRFYGTEPVPNPTIADLAFLSSRQALADTALFLQTIKATPEFNSSKVMMLGGNYAGTIATWMKVLYPHLVDAVLASSAPLLAKIDFYEFYESVTESLSTYGTQACVDKINKKFNRLKKCMETPEGIKQIMKEYDLCEDDMSRPENQQIFFLQLTMEYIYITEHGSPTLIHDYCKNILTFNSTQTKNLFPYKRNDKLGCWLIDYDFMVSLAFMFDNALYLWLYQSCTEFGWFMNTSSNKQIFGNNSIPVDFFYFSCKYAFGKEFTKERVKKGVIETNKRYGGITPNVKNVVFTNGDLDPWHKVSVLHDLSADAPAILIKGSAKSRDLFTPYDDDGEFNTENLKKAKKRVKSLLKQWIGAA